MRERERESWGKEKIGDYLNSRSESKEETFVLLPYEVKRRKERKKITNHPNR